MIIEKRPDDREIILIQQWLLDRVIAATERNPITKKFISYNHHRMMEVSLEIEQWLLYNRLPAKYPSEPVNATEPTSTTPV